MGAIVCIGAASDPAERLADPAKEARARAVFQQVRCVVCQNESIDDSEADLAHDLRQSIRQQIVQGRSDGQIRAFLVTRYGEFILLKPRFSLGNAALWLAPFGLVLIAGGALIWRARRPADPAQTADLTPEEQARLNALGEN
ncbi:MAG: cytochrome c-type biogenesis protein CcmH [Caulobacteraceae bacterium]|nr:cytochrome c-type biogenesis protein CcmH [Caulobacteraceae bacterium]